jgi:hypothetical protein
VVSCRDTGRGVSSCQHSTNLPRWGRSSQEMMFKRSQDPVPHRTTRVTTVPTQAPHSLALTSERDRTVEALSVSTCIVIDTPYMKGQCTRV